MNLANLKKSMLLFLFLSSSAYAQVQDTTACFEEVKSKIVKDSVKLSQVYLASEPEVGLVRESNHTRVHVGTNGKAAILLHGYAGSPFEVDSIAEVFQKQGYTTIQPLIFGYGSTASIANKSDASKWMATLTSTMHDIAPCVSVVSLVGFSLGGSLVTDFVLNDRSVSDGGIYKSSSGKKVRIESLVLAAPFYRLGLRVPQVIVDMLQSLMPTMNAPAMYQLTGMNDLRVFNLYPQYYNAEMPLSAGRNVLRYGRSIIKRTDKELVSDIPVLLAYSEDDITIDKKLASQFVRTHFSNFRDFVYPRSMKAPHQFMVPAVNPLSFLFLDQLQVFLRGESSSI